MRTGVTVPVGAVVLDTNVISELMRADPDSRVEGWARELEPDLTFTTAVSLAEVRFGIARLPAGHRRTLLSNAADEVFDAFADRVLGFEAAAALHYPDVVLERERAGAPIAGFDAQIAAICRSSRATLATRNTDDFDRLGLDLINPWLASA